MKIGSLGAPKISLSPKPSNIAPQDPPLPHLLQSSNTALVSMMRVIISQQYTGSDLFPNLFSVGSRISRLTVFRTYSYHCLFLIFGISWNFFSNIFHFLVESIDMEKLWILTAGSTRFLTIQSSATLTYTPWCLCCSKANHTY